MEIQTLDHLAKLSKLTFTEIKKEQFIHEMNNIIEMMDTIKVYDVQYNDMDDGGEVHLCDLREDVMKPSYDAQTLLSNTQSNSDCYVIPRMME